MKGLVIDMNSHVIVGMIEKASINKSELGEEFLSVTVTERTAYNRTGNTLNDFIIIKYGAKKELSKMKANLKEGKGLYVSGTGLFDKEGHYFIVANELQLMESSQNIVREKVIDRKEDDAVAYLRAEYEKLEKGLSNENHD